MNLILIPGTHAWDTDNTSEWYHPDSLFVQSLEDHGHILLDDERPFVWSTGIGGVGFGKGDLAVWHAAGINLYAYVVPPRCPERRVSPDQTIIISHSHGLQVVLYAAAEGLKIDTFIDVSGPVRKDMLSTARLARPNIRRWIHIHSGGKDNMQWLGELFDGHLGVVRKHPLADHNIEVKAANHGDVLRDPAYFGIIHGALSL